MSLSGHLDPAAYGKIGAGDKTGPVGAEEKDGPGDVFRLCQAPEGCVCGNDVLHLLRLPGGSVGDGQAGSHDIHANTVGPQFVGQRL